MKFGIAVTTSSNPVLTARAQADYVGRLTPVIEGLGYDSVWVSDRTIFPPDIADRYSDAFGPGRSDPEAQRVLEAITTLTFIAGRTSSVRLGFSVLVLPFRHAVLNAKTITTLDVLSGGRVIFGVGTGWMREEFEGMGATYRTRGVVTDEHIEMFKELCARDVPSYQGKHVGVDGAVFYPRPLQAPHPPVWVGGNSTAALRRAARLGDGWHGITLSPDRLSEKREALRRLCEQVGRDPVEVEVSLRATLWLDATRRTSAGDRTPLTGPVSEVADDLRRYEDAGLEYLVLSVAEKDTDATIESIERFAVEVRPALT